MEKLTFKYYEDVVCKIQKTKNKELKALYDSLEELKDHEKEAILRKSVSDVTEMILMNELDSDNVESVLGEAIEFYRNVFDQVKLKYVFRVKVKGLEKYLTREIAIPSNFSLGDLGIAIVLAFQGECCHLFQFEVNKQCYAINPEESFFDEPESIFDNELNEFNFDKKTKMKFVYDFGDYYEFSVQFVKETKEANEYPIQVLKGKGYGIWEDEHYYLDLYYYDPNTLVENWEGEQVKVSELMEFDPNEFELDEVNEMLNDTFMMCREHYEKMRG